MKKIFNIAAIATVLSILFSACCEDENMTSGYGTAKFSIGLNKATQTVTRAELDQDALARTCTLYVYQGQKLVRKYKELAQVDDLILLSGSYRAEAWAGKNTPASFTDQYYSGTTDFNVTKGSTENIEVLCYIQNVVASVKIANPEIKDALSDIAVSIGHSEGSLTFDSELIDSDTKGYFMMPEGEVTLNYTLTAKKMEAGVQVPVVRTGTISVQPAHEYVLTVKYNSDPSNIGGVYFDLEVEDVEPTYEFITISSAPRIIGEANTDITEVVTARIGELKRKLVYITTVSPLSSLVVECESFPLLNGSFDFITTTDVGEKAQVLGYGLSFEDISSQKDRTENGYIYKLVLDDAFMGKLGASKGTYTVKISATDSPIAYEDGSGYTQPKTTIATLTFDVTNDLVSAALPSAVSYTGVTLTGTVLDNNSSNYGFEYRIKESAGSTTATRAADWTRVDATLGANGTFTATITGLQNGTTYEYRPVCTSNENGSTFYGVIRTLTTAAYPQLTNAGFEDWCKDGDGAYIPSLSASNLFWDCGNHGSITMNKNVTEPASDVKHSGNYAAKLTSQFVGIGSIGKFAAGNIFIGKYLKTEGTNGIIGFGRQFEMPAKVTALKFWVKYTPGKGVNKKGADSNYIGEGQTDVGQVYIAICSGDGTDSDSNAGGVYYPFIVKTNTSTLRLFNKDEPWVLGYGEKSFESATDGNGMVQVTIPIEYFTGKTGTASYVMVVASASKYGDYFSGGEGSTMYIDDLELVYED